MYQVWVLALNTIKALFRKKDFYVFLIMLGVLLVFLYLQRFAGIKEISRYLKDIGFYVLWIFSAIIAVSFSAKQLPDEIKEKTILPLLTKPITRRQLLWGRFLGSCLASWLAFTVFYFLYMAVVFLRQESLALGLFFQSYILGLCFMSLISSIAMYLSLPLTYSAAVTVSLIIYFSVIWFMDMLTGLIVAKEGAIAVLLNGIYYLVPHFEFFDLHIRIVHDWEPLPFWVFSGLLFYTFFYVSIMMQLSYQKLKSRIF